MAATDLSDAEIVLGKLFSRLVPILGLLACALPVAALAGLMGGVDFGALIGLFAVSAAVAVLGCALAMAVSLQAARTQDAIMAVLSLWTLWLLGVMIWDAKARAYSLTRAPDWFCKANPFILVYAPYSRPGYAGPMDVAAFVAGSLAISVVLVAATIAGLRRAVLPIGPVRRAAWAPRRWLTWLPGPSLDGNPVLWREWHRARPSRVARALWALFWLASVAGMGIVEELRDGPGIRASGFLVATMALHPFLGLMLLSCRAPAPLAEERARGTLDVLMSTPISTRAIVWGKWLATYRIVVAMAAFLGLAATIEACIAPVESPRYRALGMAPPAPTSSDIIDRWPIPALVVAEIPAEGAAITGLGLFLATRVARPGRAIALSIAAFVAIAVGWPFTFLTFLLDPLRDCLAAAGLLSPADGTPRWLALGTSAVSPAMGPVLVLNGLEEPWDADRWKFTHLVIGWCLLAGAFAVTLYGEALATFDRRMGRRPEAGGEVPDGWSPRLVPDLVGCQNRHR